MLMFRFKTKQTSLNYVILMLGVQEAPAEGNAGALNINSQRNIMSKRGTLSLNGKKKKKKCKRLCR